MWMHDTGGQRNKTKNLRVMVRGVLYISLMGPDETKTLLFFYRLDRLRPSISHEKSIADVAGSDENKFFCVSVTNSCFSLADVLKNRDKPKEN